MIGFILTCIVVTAISMAIGGIPAVFIYILLEMKGLGSYVLALAVLITSIIQLIQFIFHVFLGEEIDFNIKHLFNKIKSLFSKNNKDTKAMIYKTKNKSLPIDIIEVVVVICFAIYALFVPIHGLLISIIYQNIITRVLSIIFLPLAICNYINSIRGDYFGFAGTFFMEFFLPLLCGVAIATSVMFTADVWYEDISETIQSWFIYDNRSYDEIRKKEDFKNEYEYLKSSYEKTYNQLVDTCDSNEESCLEKISENLIKSTNIKEYGYSVTAHFLYNDEVEYLCILDNKTKKYNFYKINYKNFSFELSSQEEFETLEKEQ